MSFFSGEKKIVGGEDALGMLLRTNVKGLLRGYWSGARVGTLPDNPFLLEWAFWITL